MRLLYPTGARFIAEGAPHVSEYPNALVNTVINDANNITAKDNKSSHSPSAIPKAKDTTAGANMRAI